MYLNLQFNFLQNSCKSKSPVKYKLFTINNIIFQLLLIKVANLEQVFLEVIS